MPAGIPLSNNNGYSTGDIDQVTRLYGATPASVTITYSLLSPSCGGAVSLTPAGQTMNNLTYYEDGTDVTATATPNSQYPGFVFAGWSGSLTGSTNPQSQVIHDQFIPTGNFNTVSTPITISSYSPATAPASASPLNLTITGTGFTPPLTRIGTTVIAPAPM